MYKLICEYINLALSKFSKKNKKLSCFEYQKRFNSLIWS